ncbi:MAG: prenyltransferase/squalene oxidase repeat-containing protein, partial [Anaerolineae bacterium]
MKKVFYLSFFTLFLGVMVAAAFLTHWPAFAATPKEQAIENALFWLQGQQQNDGGFSTVAAGPYPGTAQAVVSLAAANRDPYIFLSAENNSPMDYLAGQVDAQTDTITETRNAAWTALAVVAAGGDPYNFGGVNLVGRLQGYYDPASGQYGLDGDVVAQYLSMLALSVAVTEAQPITATVPQTATNLLKSWQDASGGWGWQYPCDPGAWCYPDVDNTAMALQALLAAGESPTSTAIVNGLNFLRNNQGDDGGFQSSFGTSNANSTALGIQAIYAAGQDPEGSAWEKNGNTPVEFLLSLQDSAGYFDYDPTKPSWADTTLTTIQAVPALAKKPFPLRGRYTSYKKGLRWLKTQQNADGSFPTFAASAFPGTAQGALAIAAGGEDPDGTGWQSSGGNTPIDYLENNADANTDTYTETTSTAWAIMASLAGGKDPTSFGGVNLVERLQSYYEEQTGQYGLAGDNIAQSVSIMALVASGEDVPATAVETLRNRQESGGADDGGWGFAYPCDPNAWCFPDVDNTALALQALIAAGEPPNSTSVISGLNFIKRNQGDDGGFKSWGTSNANSTAWGLQAIIAAVQNPQGPDWAEDSQTPWHFGMKLQADLGYFDYDVTKPTWADTTLTTIQMVPALANKPFP